MSFWARASRGARLNALLQVTSIEAIQVLASLTYKMQWRAVLLMATPRREMQIITVLLEVTRLTSKILLVTTAGKLRTMLQSSPSVRVP